MTEEKTMKGRLAETPLPFIVRRCYLERLDGALELRERLGSRLIFFEDGQIVSARSNKLDQRVGQFLQRSTAVSRNQVLAALAMSDSEKPIGRRLVDAGALSEKELEHSLKQLVEEIVLESFGWSDGTFRFDSSRGQLPEEVQIRVPTADLIYRGCKTYLSDKEAWRIVGKSSARMTPNQEPRLLFQHVELSEEDRKVLSYVDSDRTVEKVLTKMGGESPIIVLAALMACGLVETTEEERAGLQSQVQRITESFPHPRSIAPNTGAIAIGPPHVAEEPSIDDALKALASRQQPELSNDIAPPARLQPPRPKVEEPPSAEETPRRPPRRAARPGRRVATKPESTAREASKMAPPSVPTPLPPPEAPKPEPAAPVEKPVRRKAAPASRGFHKRRKVIRSESAPKKPKPSVSEVGERQVQDLRGRITRLHKMVGKVDHYHLFGLARRASQREIYHAYSMMCATFHPDLARQEAFADLKSQLEDIFNALVEAHLVLIDLDRRERYDRGMP